MGCRFAALIASAAFVAAPAATEMVSFEFVGEVSTLTADQGLFGMPGTVQIGDPFSGRFSYEIGEANPDQVPEDPEIGRYEMAAFEVDQSVVAFGTFNPFTIRHEPGGPTLPPTEPDLGDDWLFATVPSEGYPSLVRLRLQGPFGSAFTDDSLPSELDLADFPDVTAVQGLVAAGLFPNPSIEDVGTITELWRAPEPEAGALGALALAALASRVRAKCGRVPSGTRWATPLRSDD